MLARAGSGRQQHTLSVLVENTPGVLARIAGLFSRRGFNIESLAVGPTEDENISRMTIVVNVRRPPARASDQAAQQADQRAEDRRARSGDAVQRELLLVKVKADMSNRSHVLETVQLFRAKVVDVAPDAVTIEATGYRDKLDALLQGARALRREGTRAVRHGGHRPGARSITDRPLRPSSAAPDRLSAGSGSQSPFVQHISDWNTE